MSTHVIHHQTEHRFEITIDGHTGVAEYVDQGDVWAMNHTFVPDALRGQGVAAQLVEAAFAAARAAGVKINPLCSYVDVYMQRHPDSADLRVG